MISFAVTRNAVGVGAPESAAARSDEVKWCGFGEEIVWWQDTPPHQQPDELIRLAGTSGRAEEGRLYLVGQAGNSFLAEFPLARVALNKGRYLVVALTPDELDAVDRKGGACFGFCPLPENEYVVRTARRTQRRAAPDISAIIDLVSRDQLFDSLTLLAGLRTRHSLSTHFSSAVDWAQARLESFGFTVSKFPISVGSATSDNVVAIKPGTGADRLLVLSTAHLDSVNLGGGPGAVAPGADDNGSGAAGLVEIGRVLGGLSFEHDLRLILFGGEEQGLHGSEQYVAALDQADRSRVDAVINMDMIGTLNVPELTVLLEGAPVSQRLMDDLGDAAQAYTSLIVQTSLHPFASDHVPFIRAGLPALLTIEGSDTANTNVHTANDTLDKVHQALAVEIVRMNIAVLAEHLELRTGVAAR